MDRRDKILSNLKLGGLGLEIGPSHFPLVAGTPGVAVRILDVMNQADLVAKYTELGADTSRIQPVDYVWSGQRYKDLVGETRFDWIVASHVIEHVPDLIGFIAECAEILTEDGVLALAVPDKRGTFDYYRPPSGLGMVIDAHEERRRTPSIGATGECEFYYAEHDANPAAPAMPHGQWVTRLAMDRVREGEFLDIHAWTFTPHSFRLLIHDLHAMKMLPLREASFHDSAGPEFYIQLSRGGAGPDLDRQQLARRALEDLTWFQAPAPVADPRIEALASENACLAAELEAMRRTLSWRVTAPLRALRRGGR